METPQSSQRKIDELESSFFSSMLRSSYLHSQMRECDASTGLEADRNQLEEHVLVTEELPSASCSR